MKYALMSERGYCIFVNDTTTQGRGYVGAVVIGNNLVRIRIGVWLHQLKHGIRGVVTK